MEKNKIINTSGIIFGIIGIVLNNIFKIITIKTSIIYVNRGVEGLIVGIIAYFVGAIFGIFIVSFLEVKQSNNIEPKIFSDLAKNDENADVRLGSVMKLKDQKLLEDVVKNSKYDDARKAAEEKLDMLKKK